MSNENNYPLHPGQDHVTPYYVQVPQSEYEALKRENAQLYALINGVKSQNSNAEIDTLASECRALRAMNAKAQEEIATLKDERNWLAKDRAAAYNDLEKRTQENMKLKEVQRWRKVSEELPTPDEGYVLVLWEDGIPDIGYIGAEVDVVETVRDRGEGHSVEFWRPLPKAPEEA